MIFVRNSEEIEKIRAACRVVKLSLDAVQEAIKPGISTWKLNEIAEETTIKLGAKPAFKGYRGFPACLCTSINDEVVHGIPKKNRILKEGDIIGIDYGAVLAGYYGDSARTVPVGFKPEGKVKDLIDSTRVALEKGISVVKDGCTVQDIGRAIQNYISPKGYGIVEDYVGHGIGANPHEEPLIPHYDTGTPGAKLKAGMVICIEPMINLGSSEVRTLKDDWTVVTVDGGLSAHFEHTLVVTSLGNEVLTA